MAYRTAGFEAKSAKLQRFAYLRDLPPAKPSPRSNYTAAQMQWWAYLSGYIPRPAGSPFTELGILIQG